MRAFTIVGTAIGVAFGAPALTIPLPGVAAQVGAPADTIVPVHEEPRHRLVYDGPTTRILDIQIPKGDMTLFHVHDTAILYIGLSRSSTRSQTLGGEWSAPSAEPSRPPGDISSTTRYATTPLTHRVHNVGEGLFRLMGITNGSAGVEIAAPHEGGGAAEHENRWFRAYRVRLATASVSRAHQHSYGAAIVQVSGGEAASEGARRAPLHGAGAWTWLPAGVSHRLVNNGTKDAEIVEVEILTP